MKKLLLILIFIYSGSLYSNDKTYMQFKHEFINMPSETTYQFNYKPKQFNEEKLLQKTFVITTVAFAGSFVINKYLIPYDQPDKRRLVSIAAASITIVFSIDYLYKTNKR